jgi:hypothetical protein
MIMTYCQLIMKRFHLMIERYFSCKQEPLRIYRLAEDGSEHRPELPNVYMKHRTSVWSITTYGRYLGSKLTFWGWISERSYYVRKAKTSCAIFWMLRLSDLSGGGGTGTNELI